MYLYFPSENYTLAIAHAINPEMINKAVFYGKAVVAKCGFWPIGTWVYDDTIPRPHYDLEKAREYLKKGGMPKCFKIEIVTWKGTTMVQSTEMVLAFNFVGDAARDVLDPMLRGFIRD